MIIKCYRVSASTFECLLPVNTFCCIALILRCRRILGKLPFRNKWFFMTFLIQFEYIRRFLKQISCQRPGWERRAITLAHARIRHIKNTRVVCHIPKTLYGVLSICSSYLFSALNYVFYYCTH